MNDNISQRQLDIYIITNHNIIIRGFFKISLETLALDLTVMLSNIDIVIYKISNNKSNNREEKLFRDTFS